MEEMLIARVKCWMQVRWTKGRQCYINFRQDITAIATKLQKKQMSLSFERKGLIRVSIHIAFIV